MRVHAPKICNLHQASQSPNASEISFAIDGNPGLIRTCTFYQQGNWLQNDSSAPLWRSAHHWLCAMPTKWQHDWRSDCLLLTAQNYGGNKRHLVCVSNIPFHFRWTDLYRFLGGHVHYIKRVCAVTTTACDVTVHNTASTLPTLKRLSDAFYFCDFWSQL